MSDRTDDISIDIHMNWKEIKARYIGYVHEEKMQMKLGLKPLLTASLSGLRLSNSCIWVSKFKQNELIWSAWANRKIKTKYQNAT